MRGVAKTYSPAHPNTDNAMRIDTAYEPPGIIFSMASAANVLLF